VRIAKKLHPPLSASVGEKKEDEKLAASSSYSIIEKGRGGRILATSQASFCANPTGRKGKEKGA